jgi:YegS/Rv2252/BmrU family lipid kinase
MSQQSASPAAPIKSVYVIINPASGQDKPVLSVLNRVFGAAEVDWDAHITKAAGDAERFAREAVAAGADAVVVYGGDGTVMEVANALNGSDVPMAILPGGTANVMSVELGIPGDLEAAVGLVCGDHQVRTLDMGRVRDHLFMLRLGIGFFAETTKGAEREAKNRLGALAYTLSALQAIPKAQVSQYRITVDGETFEVEGTACFIANSGNIGIAGLSLAKTISVSDGLLDVVVLRAIDIGTILTVATNAVGLTENLPHWQGHEITLEADPAQYIECDGEVIDPTPVSVSIVRASLRVIVPAAAPAQEPTETEEATG